MNLADAPSKDLRTRRGDLTQEQFARKLGISRPPRTRLENGAQNATIKTLHGWQLRFVGICQVLTLVLR